MKEIIIYEFQLNEIINALRMTSNIHNCSAKETCHDRVVTKAMKMAQNALDGKKDEHVPHG